MNAWTVTLLCPHCDSTDFDVCSAPNIQRQEAVASITAARRAQARTR